MKKVIIILILLVLLGGGGFAYYKMRAKPKDPVEETTIAKVERGQISEIVHSTGRVVSNLDVDIKCKASGTVIKLPFDISDVVKKGEMLVELDPIDEQRIFMKAQVSLKCSQARLDVAKENYEIAQKSLLTDKQRAESDLQSAIVLAKDSRAKADRMRQLLEKNLASQEEYDTAETTAIQADSALKNAQVHIEELKTQELSVELKKQDVVLAQGQLDTDQIALTIEQDRLNDTKVTAPMDGVVTARTVQTGQIIASAVSNVGGGTTILTLSDLSHIFVIASVDEAHIGNVKEEQTAKITADAFPGKTFEGKVVQIATKGVNISNVVTFEVKLEVLGEERSLLKPEMTANIDIITAQRDNALMVPENAILKIKGKNIVNVIMPDGSKEQRPVEVGIRGDTDKEIISGLQEGESIVINKNDSQSKWNAKQQTPPAGMMLGGPPRRSRL